MKNVLAPRAWPAFALAMALGACEKTEPPTKARDAPVASTGAEAKARASTVEIHPAPAGSEDVPSIVRRERAEAQASGRSFLVYVGAPWCEPCRRFHDAALAGRLEGQLPPVTLVEFDHDRDEDRLKAAGYTSKLIPLFAVPSGDGTASGKQMEGSIKGDGAVGEITPRLRRLIGSEAR